MTQVGRSRMRWYGPRVAAELRGEIGRRIEMAGKMLRDDCRKSVSRSQATRGAGTRKRGLHPSKPGEYPKKVLGHLRRNIESEYEHSELTARVGTNVLYGKFLELGTSVMARRPWLSLSVRRMRSIIRRVLTRKMP